MKLHMKLGLLLLPLFLLAGCPTTVNQSTTPPVNPNAVVIGLIETLATGSYAERVLAARLAISEINAAGGVNGQPLDLSVVYDNNSTPSAGVAGAQSLAASGVVAMVGANASVVTLAVEQQVTIPDHIALVTPGSTSPVLSTLATNGTFYRIPPSDALQGKVLAQQVWNEGHTTVEIFALDEPYGNGLIQAFSQAFSALGGTVQAAVTAPATQASGYSSQIASLYAQGTPGVLMLFTFAQQSATLLREIIAARGSLPPMLYGVDANMSNDFIANAPPQIAGMRGTTPGSSASTPAYQHFLQAFVAVAGYAPDPNTENSYDAVYAIALAMEAAGSNTRAGVIAQLPNVDGVPPAGTTVILPGQFAQAITALKAGQSIHYDGASGNMNWDSHGDPTTGAYQYLEIAPTATGLQLETLETINI